MVCFNEWLKIVGITPHRPLFTALMATPSFTYTGHALERMRERKISKRQVEKAVLEPHRQFTSKGRQVAERGTAHGNVLRVVYNAGYSGTEIVSAVIITAVRISP